MDRLDLLTSLIGVYVAQPATAFWRAIELDAIQRLGLPAGRGLDIGCGDGKLTEILLRSIGGRRLVGVDMDALETRAAAGHDFYEAVHTAPADRVPEASGSFDFAVSNSVLEHIPDLEAGLDLPHSEYVRSPGANLGLPGVTASGSSEVRSGAPLRLCPPHPAQEPPD